MLGDLKTIYRRRHASDAGARPEPDEAVVVDVELPVLHEREVGAAAGLHDDHVLVERRLPGDDQPEPEQVPMAGPIQMGGEEDRCQEGEGRS